jgi:putative phosphoesterase
VRTTDVLLVADTHLGPGQADRLLARIAAELAPADVVLHAGDIIDASVLDELAAHVPAGVHAVHGNNDLDLRLPQQLLIDVDGCAVALVHDSGPAAGRTRRLRRWFPDADAVVFGHSHLPWHEVDVRPSDRHVQHHVNPGSAMVRRRAPVCTVAHLLIRGGQVDEVRHVAVGPAPTSATADVPQRYF